MKLNKIFSKRTAYIMLFGILYLAVAFTSTLHAIQFFGLTNENYLAVVLAIAFEIGQAAVLLSLLTTKGERGKITPWVLMCIFTIVQIIGNVFSSYKYAVLHSIGNLRFFKEPIFVWTSNISDNVANVIVTYISSSILPIAALLLTSMIANYITDNDETLDTPINELESTKHDKLIKDETPENVSEKAPTASTLDNTLINDNDVVEREEIPSTEPIQVIEPLSSTKDVIDDEKTNKLTDNENSNQLTDNENSNQLTDNIKQTKHEYTPAFRELLNNSRSLQQEDKPIEDKPIEDKPIEDKPIEDKPIEDIKSTPNPIDFETERQEEQIKKSGFVNL